MVHAALICLQLVDTHPLTRSFAGYLESLQVFLAIRSYLAQTDRQKLRTPRRNIPGPRAQNRW